MIAKNMPCSANDHKKHIKLSKKHEINMNFVKQLLICQKQTKCNQKIVNLIKKSQICSDQHKKQQILLKSSCAQVVKILDIKILGNSSKDSIKKALILSNDC